MLNSQGVIILFALPAILKRYPKDAPWFGYLLQLDRIQWAIQYRLPWLCEFGIRQPRKTRLLASHKKKAKSFCSHGVEVFCLCVFPLFQIKPRPCFLFFAQAKRAEKNVPFPRPELPAGENSTYPIVFSAVSRLHPECKNGVLAKLCLNMMA